MVRVYWHSARRAASCRYGAALHDWALDARARRARAHVRSAGGADPRRCAGVPGIAPQPALRAAGPAGSLPAFGVDYLWLPALGGHRRRPPGAPPSPWRVEAFAAYAEHMRSPEFRGGIRRAHGRAGRAPDRGHVRRGVPYRCHRRLIPDWAALHDVEVVHLIDERRSERHHVTPFARRDGDDVVYEADAQLDLPIGSAGPSPRPSPRQAGRGADWQIEEGAGARARS